jgi:hypothetical protein
MSSASRVSIHPHGNGIGAKDIHLLVVDRYCLENVGIKGEHHHGIPSFIVPELQPR